ncbi:MAG: hypothetical protein ABJC19_04325 [Gemmatimonadota bacterium]
MPRNLTATVLFAASFVVAPALAAQRADSADAARSHYRQARSALAANDNELGFQEAVLAVSAWPRQGVYWRFLARVAATTGHSDEALAALDATTAMGFDWLPGDSLWTSLRSDPRFGTLVQRAAAAIAPIAASTVAATLPKWFEHAEGVAYDSRTGRRFVGSVRQRTIVVIDNVGLVRDFVTNQSEPRLYAVFGMAADAQERVLWVTTSAMKEQEGGVAADSGVSELRAYHLDNGRILGRWRLPAGAPHCLGDVVLGPDGAAYATDSCEPHIYRATINGELTPLRATHRDWRNLQGIAFAPDGCTAWVADWTTGLYRIDLVRQLVTPVAADPRLVTLGIDGVYWGGNNSLIAIQNGVSPARVVRLTLNEAGKTVERLDVLDRHPSASEPSLGVVLHDALIYVANSSWSNYTGDGTPAGPFEPQILLKLPVRGLRPAAKLTGTPSCS